MVERVRKSRLEIRLTDKERKLFETKMKCKTLSHFIRKGILEKEVFIVDLESFRDLKGFC